VLVLPYCRSAREGLPSLAYFLGTDMDLKTLATEMRATALKYPFTPSLENIVSHPATERDVDIDGRPMRFIFTKNIFKREHHGFEGEFWHLSVCDRRHRPIPKPLLESILKEFFDPDLYVEQDPNVPGVALHFSQVLKASL